MHSIVAIRTASWSRILSLVSVIPNGYTHWFMLSRYCNPNPKRKSAGLDDGIATFSPLGSYLDGLKIRFVILVTYAGTQEQEPPDVKSNIV